MATICRQLQVTTVEGAPPPPLPPPLGAGARHSNKENQIQRGGWVRQPWCPLKDLTPSETAIIQSVRKPKIPKGTKLWWTPWTFTIPNTDNTPTSASLFDHMCSWKKPFLFHILKYNLEYFHVQITISNVFNYYLYIPGMLSYKDIITIV